MKTLMVTGALSSLGKAVARRAGARGWRVIGVDRKSPSRPIQGMEFVQTDVNNPLLSRLLKAEGIDVIFHAAFRWRVRATPDIFENNVVGTAKLLEAAEAASVRKFIFPSSAFVYGAHPQHPYLIPEDAPFRGASNYGYIRDLRDIETFLRGFRQQRPGMVITVLRFANILGRGYASPLARYLRLPFIPTPLHSDPLLPLLHLDDAVRAAMQAIEKDHAGVYNVAAAPPTPLLEVITQAGRHAAPLPDSLVHGGQSLAAVIAQKGTAILPLPWDYLRFSWALSTRKIREAWGFEPQFDAEALLRDFARELQTLGPPSPPLHKALSIGKKALRAFSSLPKSSPP